MSLPPEYQSLTQHDPDEHIDAKLPHSYPPTAIHGNADVEGGGPSTTVRPGVATVNYTFTPRYPVRGSVQDAFGILYPSHEATALSLQRMFPTLAEYDLDRIEILAQKGEGDRWGIIMDNAWEHIAHQPPHRIVVRVKDQPGDQARRDRREVLPMFLVGGLILLAFVGGIVASVISNERKKHEAASTPS